MTMAHLVCVALVSTTTAKRRSANLPLSPDAQVLHVLVDRLVLSDARRMDPLK